ncbi:MAG: hypothetical protein EA385_05345 [Salinarimonadaceae bacterium]|nr:MAG: hypothetical protein EA385_05345 [Salinarimonadaceae bacterium]
MSIRIGGAAAALLAATAFAQAQTPSAPQFLLSKRSFPAFFETPEYRANIGLSLINASSAYAAGWTGAGSLIAVIDDGFQVAHPELGPKVVEAFNPTTGGLVPVESHGTHVAGIAGGARDGAGMHGVAYGARLALYSFGQDLKMSRSPSTPPRGCVPRSSATALALISQSASC